jgi:hypothetical protein
LNITVNPGVAPTITSPNTSGTNLVINSGVVSGTFTITATGTPSNETFTVTGGALPAGVKLNATTGVLSSDTTTAATAGSSTVQITAHNGVNPDATQTLTINLDQVPAFTGSTSATFTQNSAGSATVTATGFPAATFTETGNLPLGVTFNPGTGVFSGTPTTFGTFPVTVTAGNAVGTASETFTLTVNGVAGGFGVLGSSSFAGTNGFTPTPNGFLLRFTGPILQSSAVLYQGPEVSSPLPANITLFSGSASTTLRGSFLIDPSAQNSGEWLFTEGGSLASGSYTMTVGSSLQGVGGITGPGFTQAFTFTAPSAPGSTPVISLPAFARGPGQIVNVPNTDASDTTTTNGIPVTISNVTNATSVSYDVMYDPTLLTITAGSVSASTAATAAGLTVVNSSITPVDAHHSLLAIKMSGSSTTGLTAGSSGVVLAIIPATVPLTAPYTNKAVLDVQDVQINGINLPGAGDDGVIAAAYFGDVRRDSNFFTPLGAFQINQVAGGKGTGFTAYKDLDPQIIGDTSGTGQPLAPLDAFQVNAKSSGANVPTIPTPAVGSSTSTVSGADPILFFQAAQGGQGQAVTVHLLLNVTEASGFQLAALAEAIAFDPTVFTVSNVVGGAGETFNILGISESGSTVTVITDNPVPSLAQNGVVTLSGVPVSGYNGSATIGTVGTNSLGQNFFTFTSSTTGLASSKGGTVSVTGLNSLGTYTTTAGTVDNTTGHIRIGQFFSGSGNAPTVTNGELIDVVDFTATINGSASIGSTSALNLLASYTSNGTTTITSVSNPTGNLTLNPAPTDASTDAVDATLGVIAPFGTLSIGSANTSAGSTVTVPINFQNGSVSFPLAALAEAISFDPTVLQVTNVTGGTGLSNLGTYTTTAGTIDNTTGHIRIGQFFSGSGNAPTINPGQAIDVVEITFSVNSSASGNTIVGLLASFTSNGTTTITSVSNPSGNITLTPAPSNTGGPDDGTLSIVIVPNQPPFDHVPLASAISPVLFNPANVNGLHTSSTPNSVTFSGSTSISVTDPDGGVGTETTELKLTGGGVSSGSVGTLTINGSLPTGSATITTASESSSTVTITTSAAHNFTAGEVVTISGVSVPGYNGTFTILSSTSTTFTYIDSVTGLGSATAGSASFALSVSGNNSNDVILNGPLANINLALSGLQYTPGAGYFGTTTLSVSTNDNGNTGFGGAQTDTRTTSITVVGLYISEIYLGANASSPQTAAPNQYIEIFSTVPNYTIPSNVYLVGVNGNNDTTINDFIGQLTDTFNLGGVKTGSNGYVALLEKGNTYSTSFEINTGVVSANNGTGAGFGSGSGSSSIVVGSTTVVHTGVTTGGTDDYGLSTDIQQGSVSFLLIQAPSAPAIGDSIDTGGTTAPTGVAGGTEYNSWNVLDGIGILRNQEGTFGQDATYSPLTFVAPGNIGSSSPGLVQSGSSTIGTGSYTPTYVARIAQNTGYSTADWLASAPTSSDTVSGGFNLDSTNSTKFGGQSANSIGGPNFWAPELSVQLNDGNVQHSQVGYLVLNFNEAVTIGATDLTTVFKVTDSENVTAASWASGTASITLQFPVTLTAGSSSVTISGMTPAGFNGTFLVTGVSGNTFTYSLANNPGSGPVGFGKVTGNNLSLSITSNGTVGSSSITNVTQVIIKFNSGSPDTFNFATGSATVGTSTSNGGQQLVNVGLNDGNYFLNTDGTKISNNGVFLDYQHNGNPGSTGGTQVDEFWRLFGDSRGTRGVSAANLGDFQTTEGQASTITTKTGKAPNPNYKWYFDSNEDQGVDVGNTIDKTAFNNHLFSSIKV